MKAKEVFRGPGSDSKSGPYKNWDPTPGSGPGIEKFEAANQS